MSDPDPHTLVFFFNGAFNYYASQPPYLDLTDSRLLSMRFPGSGWTVARYFFEVKVMDEDEDWSPVYVNDSPLWGLTSGDGNNERFQIHPQLQGYCQVRLCSGRPTAHISQGLDVTIVPRALGIYEP